MLTFSYPLRTGEQGLQGNWGRRGTGRTAKKKGTEDTGEQGEKRNRETGGTTTYVRTIYDETKGQ